MVALCSVIWICNAVFVFILRHRRHPGTGGKFAFLRRCGDCEKSIAALADACLVLGWNDGRHGGGVWRRQTVGIAACAKVWQVCRNYRRTVGAIPRLVLPLREMGHFVWLLCPGGAANMSIYGGGEPVPVSDVSFVGYAGDSWLGRSADIGWSIAWPTYPYPPDFFSACRFGIVFALFVGDMDWTAETQKIC